MSIEIIEFLAVITAWVLALPMLYKVCNDMFSFLNEVKILKGHLSELQERLDDLETIVNAHTYYICDVLRKEEGEKNG